MHDLDLERLAEWTRGNIPRFPALAGLEKFAGGQSNPTYLLRTAAEDYVLRRKPFGPILPSAHAVGREFHLLRAIGPQGFPVPAAVALCDDESVIGAPFYIMERTEGRTFWDGTLPGLAPAERRAIYEALVDTMARLHRIDHRSAGLFGFAGKGNYLERQVRRWTTQYRAAQTDEIEAVEQLIAWLPLTMPRAGPETIVHGDYRIDNVIFAADAPRLLAVLDWELATIGDPLADFAYFALSWILPPDGGSGLAGVDLEQAGIPSLDEIVRRYCLKSGRGQVSDLRWYFAFNLFRLVGILQGIKRRLLDGNASSASAAQKVASIEPLAELGWQQAMLACMQRAV